LEEPDCTIRRSERRIGLAERRVDVRSEMCRRVVLFESRLELLDRVEVISSPRSREAERVERARSGDVVAGAPCVLEHLAQLCLDGMCVIGEPQLELGVAELELALLRIADLSTCFQVLDGDGELAREHA